MTAKGRPVVIRFSKDGASVLDPAPLVDTGPQLSEAVRVVQAFQQSCAKITERAKLVMEESQRQVQEAVDQIADARVSGRLLIVLAEAAARDGGDRYGQTDEGRREIADRLDALLRDLGPLTERDDPVDKQTALRIAERALFLGYAAGVPQEGVRAIGERAARELVSGNAGKARAAKAEKGSIRQQKLRAAIIGALNGHPPANSSKLAESIMLEVKKRIGLGQNENWPSARTIQREMASMSATLEVCSSKLAECGDELRLKRPT